ncbi:MAG: hypothetical protein AB1898_22500 [Acidobacteriota bacterium]
MGSEVAKGLRSVLISVICLIAVNALAAIQSMTAVGNSFSGAVELMGYSLLGPFTGWVFQTASQQWTICVMTGLLVTPVFFLARRWTIILAIVGVAIWLLPNAVPMSTGI